MPPRRVIGIDAGGTKLLGGVVDEDLLVHHRVHRTWRGADRAETIEIFADAIEEARVTAPDIDAIGIGLPSLVDTASGTSAWSNHLPIDGVPFAALLSERLGVSVFADNDVNAAAVAEHHSGAAAGADHAILIALGTGIGGGLILDGKLYRGAHGFAGELGHMVVDADGDECPGACPGRGCFEVVASGQAIGSLGRRLAVEEPGSTLGRRLAEGAGVTGPIVTELAHGGDEQARGVLERVGTQLGIGLAGIANVFDPEVIVVGGGAVGAGDLLLGPARLAFARRALPPIAEGVRIEPATYGAESGMLGAALLALGGGHV